MKCILLVRVSTEAQSYDEQEKELYELALKKGYSAEDITSIAEKESGIKLSEEERKGLNRMKELLSTGEYNCVFAWEISRIARKKKILFSISDYLVDRKIQLIIKDPYLELLKEDGSINEGAETMFTLFSQLAESEMRNKAARFARGRKESYNRGKYQGGKIKLGYRIDENGYWQIDEEGAQIIRMIFEMYNTGEYSMTDLAKELKARGYFPAVSTITNVKTMLSHILRDDVYRGKRTSNNLFPRIIDDETWILCEKRRLENRKIGAKKAQRLLSALIRCKCGASYSANLLDCCYECRVRHNAVEKGIEHSPSINLNMAESIAWYVALNELQNDAIEKREFAKAEYEKEIDIQEQKIKVSEETIATIHKRRADLEDRYFGGGRISKERFEELAAKMDDSEDEERNNILKYKSRIKALTHQIEVEQTFDDLLNGLIASYDELKGGTDIELMRKIVRRYIAEVRIERLETRSPFYYKKIIIQTHNSSQPLNQQLPDDLSFVFANTFYVDTQKRKAFFDEDYSNEVPMVYMERERRRRIEYRKKKKK